MKKIAKDKLQQLWQAITANYQLYLPIEKNEQVNFSLWQKGDRVNLERLKTVIPPKQLTFPQTETYLKFKTEGKKLHLEAAMPETQEYVVFGVRACDAAGIKLIDNVFLKDPVDRLYEQRRNNGIIVTLACGDPEENCFCGAFGIAAEKASACSDVAVWDVGEFLLWQAQTTKGETLTEILREVLVDATEEDDQCRKDLEGKIREKLAALPMVGLKLPPAPKELNDYFESEIWDKFSERCLGCGACTFICPTCHCYDIQDFDGGKSGERFRCWDSCMFSDFTLMAHGNPRKTQKERFRQRFLHKLVYYPENYGAYACVGCGRCVAKCPVKLNIVKVIKKLGGEAK